MSVKYLINEVGEKTAVQISIKEWERILEELEIAKDISLCNEVLNDESMTYKPLDEVMKSIEREKFNFIKANNNGK